jgi:hypothetical protein
LFPDFLPDLVDRWNILYSLVSTGKKPATEGSVTAKPQEEKRKKKYEKLSVGGEITQAFFSFVIFAIILVLEMVFRTTIAVTIALLDTVIWVAVVFATAAPMMLSGLYEAAIDRQVIDALENIIADPEPENENLTQSLIPVSATPKDKYQPVHYMKHRVHLLYALLTGNLAVRDMAPKKRDTLQEDLKTPQDMGKAFPPAAADDDIERQIHAYQDVKWLVDLIKDVPFDLMPGNAARTLKVAENVEGSKGQEPAKETARATDSEIQPVAATRDPEAPKDGQVAALVAIEKTRYRLNAMLDCQAGFGGAIGAPIVFFIGSFLVSVVSNLAQLGNSYNAFAISFGTWWITVPHVAIISGCLLAGNNPNTLQAIMCNLRDVPHKDFSKSLWRQIQDRKAEGKTFWEVLQRYVTGKDDHGENPIHRSKLSLMYVRELINAFFWPVYDSFYQPVWMWDRGRSKRTWVRMVQREPEYPTTEWGIKRRGLFDSFRNLPQNTHHGYRIPQSLGTLIPIEWFYITVLAIALICYPFVLATLTSYYTPTLGLSCRSFTFVIYFIAQFWLGTAWVIDFQKDKRPDMLWTPGFQPFGFTIRLPTIFAAALWLGFLVSIFTSFIGTFMQIAGVYRNCLCNTPLKSWGSKTDFEFQISDNSPDDIKYAHDFWQSTGIAAIALLLGVCYGGWWYQRHWRAKFSGLIDIVLNARAVDPDTDYAEPPDDAPRRRFAINPPWEKAEARAAKSLPEKGQEAAQAVNPQSEGPQAEASAVAPATEPDSQATDATAAEPQLEALAVGSAEQPQSEAKESQP